MLSINDDGVRPQSLYLKFALTQLSQTERVLGVAQTITLHQWHSQDFITGQGRLRHINDGANAP